MEEGKDRKDGRFTTINITEEGWAMAGIVMTAVTLFGMLGLFIASVRMESDQTEAAGTAEREIKKAA